MNGSAAQKPAQDRFLGTSAVYYCDLSRDAEPQLVLAHLVELIRPPYRGIGLIARTRLDPNELACMDEIGRRLLARPYDYLHQECERVRQSASPGCAIAALSTSHYAALKIAPPQELDVPPALASVEGSCSATTVMAALTDMLQRYGELGGNAAIEGFCEAL